MSGHKPPKTDFTTAQQTLKKNIHRALVEARKAIYRGDEALAKEIVRQIMVEAATEAYRANREDSYNWVVEELKPLDELMLPE